MSQTLKISNYAQLNILEKTQLSADAASAQAVLTVQNNNNFATNSHAIVGRITSENLEKVLVLSVAGSTTVTASSNLVFTHAKFTDVTKIFGDQIRVYRAADVDGTPPADGSFSILATVNIDFDDAQTTYTDATGSSSYWYKSVYYDSVADSETALANSQAIRGGGYGNYATLSSIRQTAGLQNNDNISDALVEEKRQAAQSVINAALSGRYTIPFTSPIPQLIAEVTRLLAAGYLLTQELGANSSSSGIFFNEGMAMIDRVTNDQKTGILDRLDSGSLTLVDSTGTSQATATGGNFKAWPDSTTATASAADGGGERMFRVTDEY